MYTVNKYYNGKCIHILSLSQLLCLTDCLLICVVKSMNCTGLTKSLQYWHGQNNFGIINKIGNIRLLLFLSIPQIFLSIPQINVLIESIMIWRDSKGICSSTNFVLFAIFILCLVSNLPHLFLLPPYFSKIFYGWLFCRL